VIDERITPNFWLSEFLQSATAVRKGIDNTPKATELANVRNMLIPGMQSVRDCLGQPVFITSGYRSPEVNRAIGGSTNSQHSQGLAADFKAPAFGMPRQIVKHLMQHCTQVRYDQLICEGEWVHISFAPKPRGQVLTAHFSSAGVRYTPGLS
jgi:zinc D-Ala-D-Ala carboxypeptidase